MRLFVWKAAAAKKKWKIIFDRQKKERNIQNEGRSEIILKTFSPLAFNL